MSFDSKYYLLGIKSGKFFNGLMLGEAGAGRYNIMPYNSMMSGAKGTKGDMMLLGPLIGDNAINLPRNSRVYLRKLFTSSEFSDMVNKYYELNESFETEQEYYEFYDYYNPSSFVKSGSKEWRWLSDPLFTTNMGSNELDWCCYIKMAYTWGGYTTAVSVIQVSIAPVIASQHWKVNDNGYGKAPNIPTLAYSMYPLFSQTSVGYSYSRQINGFMEVCSNGFLSITVAQNGYYNSSEFYYNITGPDYSSVSFVLWYTDYIFAPSQSDSILGVQYPSYTTSPWYKIPISYLGSGIRIEITDTPYDPADPGADNPYLPPHNPGDTTDDDDDPTQGGGGDHDNSSDTTREPELPGYSATAIGFCRLYNPTTSQLVSLSKYLWSDLFSLDSLKKLFADPMDLILSLSVFPVQPTVGSSESVHLGPFDSGVSMNPITEQFKKWDCGSVTLPEYWGAYLDYDPYTKLSLYLPYIGEVDVNADEVINKPVSIKYEIDFLSGACVALLIIDSNTMYQFSGVMNAQIPVSANDFRNIYTSMVSIATRVDAAMNAPTPVGKSAVVNAVQNENKNMSSMYGGLVSDVISSKVRYRHSGGTAGSAGHMTYRAPYFIINRPNQDLAAQYNTFVGYPCNKTLTLSNVKGFTIIENIHLQNVYATDSERDEIMSLLQGGVIF